LDPQDKNRLDGTSPGWGIESSGLSGILTTGGADVYAGQIIAGVPDSYGTFNHKLAAYILQGAKIQFQHMKRLRSS
jgi:hypothetical protein